MGVYKKFNDINNENLTADEVSVALKQPRLFKVVLLNDDYTPMDFVIQILQYFFGMEECRAIQVMLQVHCQGRADCGIYTREIAETKVAQVNHYARVHEHPLLCCMEVTEN